MKELTTELRSVVNQLRGTANKIFDEQHKIEEFSGWTTYGIERVLVAIERAQDQLHCLVTEMESELSEEER